MLAGTPLPPAYPGEPRLWQQVYSEYFFWADRYGWPPTVVDEQPAIVLDRLREVTVVVDEWRHEQAESDG